MMKNFLSIILLLLIYSCKPNQSSSVDDIEKKVESNNFEVRISSNQLPDNVVEYNYYLIDNDSKDSIELLTALRHDLPPPNFFWTKAQKLLIYEQGGYGNEKSTIKLFNPITKKTIHETKGFFQKQSNQQSNFLDKKNNTLFYFITNEVYNTISIKKIDLSNYNELIIYEFRCMDMAERPTLSINQAERVLSFSYSCQEPNKENMTSENGEVKY